MCSERLLVNQSLKINNYVQSYKKYNWRNLFLKNRKYSLTKLPKNKLNYQVKCVLFVRQILVKLVGFLKIRNVGNSY